MDNFKIRLALGIIWVRIYGATHNPITSDGAKELRKAIGVLGEEADDKDILGRRLIDFCNDVLDSKVFEARYQPATGLEGLVRSCESFQNQIVRVEPIINEIFGAISVLLEEGKTGKYKIKIRREVATKLFEESGQAFTDKVKERFFSDGVEALNDELIPHIPPSLPLWIPSIEENTKIPKSPGFSIEAII